MQMINTKKFVDQPKFLIRQQGVVAVATSLVLLLLVTIGTVYVSRTVTLEHRISANEVRAKDAFEAAEAGRNFAMTFLDIDNRDMDGDGISDRVEMLTALGFSVSGVFDDINDGAGWEYDDCDDDNDADTGSADGDCGDTGDYAESTDYGYRIKGNWNSGTSQYDFGLPTSVSDCEAASICLVIRMGEERYTAVLESTGRSDDGSAEKTVFQTLRYATPYPSGYATHPLITFSTVRVGGSMTVVNVFSNATIWSGGDVEGFGAGGSSQRGTLIHPNADGPQTYTDGTTGDIHAYFDENGNNAYDSGEELLDPGLDASNLYTANDLTKSSGGDGANTYLGADVIDGSVDLATSKATDPDGFFKNFFAGSPEFAKEAADYITTSDRLTDPSGTHGIDGSMIWVDASGGAFTLKNGDYGTPAKPIVLIIDGDLDLAASPRIFGLLMVRGDVVGGGSGGGEVVGAAIIEGDNGVDGSGGFDVIYEPNILSRAGDGQNRIAVAAISGTWRDWQ